MLQAGTVVADQFRVLGQIDEGGMGLVFEAQSKTGERVAIKVLRRELVEDAVLVERFLREARTAAAIEHEHVTNILDLGTHEGLPFIVMEFLAGESLGARIKARGALPVVESVRIISQLLDALSAVHNAGFVHRDLKPDNVFLITRDANDHYVKLLDFGLARNAGAKTASSMSLTTAGSVLGTPRYMAPEQLMARPDLDARADVYSVGVIAYELLTGKPPIDGSSTVELMSKVLMRDGPLPTMATHGVQVPEGLEKAVFRALEKDREARWPDARAFASAIAEWDESSMGAADTLMSIPDVTAAALRNAKSESTPNPQPEKKSDSSVAPSPAVATAVDAPVIAPPSTVPTTPPPPTRNVAVFVIPVLLVLGILAAVLVSRG